jgi:hypothetical protein
MHIMGIWYEMIFCDTMLIVHQISSAIWFGCV